MYELLMSQALDLSAQAALWLSICVAGRWAVKNMELLSDGNVGGAVPGEVTFFGVCPEDNKHWRS